MFPLFERLFRRHPPGFPRRISARFEETLVYEGAMRTGADLFAKGGGQALAPLVFHRFIFERDGRLCHFMVRDDERAMSFAPGEIQTAHLDTTGDRAWFRGAEYRAFEVPKPDPEDEDA